MASVRATGKENEAYLKSLMQWLKCLKPGIKNNIIS
jgi:hypothetical protein